MIESLLLQNFRCFNRHEIPFREKTIIVGKNNAGKSSIIEALRLVSIISERFQYLSYNPPPRWLELHKANRGVTPSLDSQAFNFEKVFHRHNDPPAIVFCRFTTGASISVYIGTENRIHGVVRDSRNHIIGTKSEALRLELPAVAVLPQVAPVRSSERIIEEDRVRQYALSSLAPLHFRNQLAVFAEFFDEFKRISEETWHGLEIQKLVKYREKSEPHLQLMVRNEDFVADVSWMGHGLQMWLQTMWFLARCYDAETIILDEPDVYMHADLQRKLIRFLRNRHPQVIIATHSTEIMAEVGPSEILVIDKDKTEAKFAADLPEVQQIIAQIGGVHNIQLARMVNSKRCIFVEGDDLDILKRLQNTLFPDSEHPIDVIPNLSIGGWGGWNYVIGSSMWVDSNMKGIAKYCVLDSDYHTRAQLDERLAEAKVKDIRLRIWSKKELENYLLVPSALARLIRKLSRNKRTAPDEDAIREKLDEIAEGLRETVVGGKADEIGRERTKLQASTAYTEARKQLNGVWGTFEGRISVVPGKTVLAEFNRWLRDEYKISFSSASLAAELKANEIDQDVQGFLEAVEFNEPV